jgi:tRNA pseudouridine38-40 synthase
LKVGKGQLSVDGFEHYLISRETPELITPAHPQGLYLSKVTNPYLNLPPREEFSSFLQNQSADIWIPI